MGRPLPLQAAPPSGPLAIPQLELKALEVTQVVQNLQHEVPLIAEKDTLLRCYLVATPGGPMTPCRGEAEVVGADGSIRRVPSINAILPGLHTVQAMRQDLSLSLNFILPREACSAGAVSLVLDFLSTGSIDRFQPTMAAEVSKPLRVTFTAAPPLRVKLYSIRYRRGNPPASHVPTARDVEFMLSWLRRTYPVARVISTHATIDAKQSWPFSCVDINTQLAALRRQDMAAGGDARTHYYGIVSDASGEAFMRGCASDVPTDPSPDTVASGPTGAGDFGWDTDGSYGDWYGGHELAHTFGRAHPGYCSGNSSDDPAYPFADGKLANADGAFVGLDFGDSALGLSMAALPGRQWADVMTYCAFQWMSSYTFDGLRRRLQNEDTAFSGPLPSAPMILAATASPAGTALVNVIAVLDLERGTGKILEVNPLERGVPSRPHPESEAVLEVVDSSGQPLLVRPIRIKQSSCGEGEAHHHGMIDAVLAVPPDGTEIRLHFRGKVVHRYVVSATVLSLEMPPSASGVAMAAPGVHYNIQARTAPETPWITLATGLPTPTIPDLRENFPGQKRIQVRLIATNGFTRAQSERDVTVE